MLYNVVWGARGHGASREREPILRVDAGRKVGATVDQFEANIGSAISVKVAAPPMADVVFLPTDLSGTPGRLNSEILGRLGLPKKLPHTTDLKKGYHVEQSATGLLCYVVTVADIPAPDALRTHLSQALADPSLGSVRSIWLPLMGTGAGRIPFNQSFAIILDVLRSSPIIAEGNATALISLPQDIPPDARDGLMEAIRKASAQAESAQPKAGSLSAAPYELARSDAVTGVLQHASRLARLRREQHSVLSTTLLFFALAESQAAAAPAALREDMAAEFFSAAVHLLAADRYPQVWLTYFGTDERLSSLEPQSALLGPSESVAAVLQKAHVLASGASKPIQIDHLVSALLVLEEATLLRVLAQMQIEPDKLLTEYRDARLGQVATKFNNDVATGEDRLGYDSYATAIYEFLTHAETPPPLSISIQAPWGGGKSSLMNLVREKLDPRDVRERHKPSVGGLVGAPRLLLGSVVRMLDRKEDFSVRADQADLTDGRGRPKRLWTIWFNAWKYDSTEQVWAGLVDAIVSQVSERLPPLEREKFLLKLQLARIDDGVIRKRIYDRVIAIWWAKVRAWALAGATVTLGLVGLGAVKPALPEAVQTAISLWSGNGYIGAVAAQVVLSVYLVASYFKSGGETRKEPATFSLAEYIRVPDYSKPVGEIHRIHSDLRRVLGVVPKQPGESDHAPIVIFIDDLDRCSPSKVASVVEGVSMLLASDTYRCMFVIGMDPQMVAAALEKEHEDVRKQLPRYERAVPLGWRFMDKFIQLPFTIPPSGGRQFKGYVDWLVGVAPPQKQKGIEGEAAADPAEAAAAEGSAPSGDGPGGAPPQIDLAVGRSPEPQPASVAAAAFVESRDVGAIIRKISAYSVGNPREMKRMVNLARFYLALRSARRLRDDGWRAPDLDQYARWIAVTLRWPDMLRWLQWGADEAHWPPEQLGTELMVRRLRALEACALTSDVPAKWRAALKSELNVPVDSDSDWACDAKLFEFFKAESEILIGKRLSDAAGRAFW